MRLKKTPSARMRARSRRKLTAGSFWHRPGDLSYHWRTSGQRRASPVQLAGGERERLSQAAKLLRKAERGVRVLRTVAWSPEVAQRFFARGARELPEVVYDRPDPEPVLQDVAAAHALVDGDTPVHVWLCRV